jgi:undecaprenyl diphosphate synthase
MTLIPCPPSRTDPTCTMMPVPAARGRHHGRQREVGSRAGAPRHEGHRAGMKAVREVIEGRWRPGQILTLFAFSTENWFRPEEEILALMALLRLYADQEKEELRERRVRVRVLGDLTGWSPRPRGHRRDRGGDPGRRPILVNLMISYSGRAELVRAVQTLARARGPGELDGRGHRGSRDRQAPWTRPGLPDPDLLIRTSGEFRISNFHALAAGLHRAPHHPGPLARLHPARTSSRRSANTSGGSGASAGFLPLRREGADPAWSGAP